MNKGPSFQLEADFIEDGAIEKFPKTRSVFPLASKSPGSIVSHLLTDVPGIV